ncbi:NADH:flavin oxidoreductase [Leisingera sp. ANG-M1]|uniref:oxidoreductase n=1 Tax=Leisingera sp. ANG-M1 TaxID=1577895 RepID=UPI000580ACD9|nr:FAD-dependent oxidoreductase [Leisingera sp. ANG-M1]KIC09232.1 NADH:flavin oxidoreductase [Leisingera sp. ANG-M1]
MTRDPRYDILFEPVKIGPVTAKNRFYQVPHCSGTSDNAPDANTRMREMKAEGGWGVVCTEIAEIANTTEFWPYPSLHLWSDDDIKRIARMPEAVHRHGALAGVELGHVGLAAGNRASRTPPLGPGSFLTLESVEPFQSKMMDKQDIKTVREQHIAAAVRAKKAGFDIIYAYASHGLSIFSQFLQSKYNTRSDEYGGSLENRARLLREVLEGMKEAVGDTSAVAFRFAVNEVDGDLTQGQELVEMLKDIPDLWDVNLSDWPEDSQTSRFSKEGFQEEQIAFVKEIVNKPVVSVGRFTSPDTMLSQVKRGVLDLVGAARPSIADPFIPNKINEGRVDDIRECIGCNICASGELSYAPMRCTQNPTVMDEYRRGWHPERVEPKGSDDSILIVGGGPAGLECANVLSKRGYEVTVADARAELGGRVKREAGLPGLSEWIRVADYRLYALQQLGNVSLYTESPLTAEDILDFGMEYVVLATGAKWRRDGVGRWNQTPVLRGDEVNVLTPDDLLDGAGVSGPVVIYDEDGAYMGNVLAEKLVKEGHQVTYVTPANEVAPYLALTMEQHKVIARLMQLGVRIERLKMLESVSEGSVKLACVHGGEGLELPLGTIVLLTSKLPEDTVYQELIAREAEWADAGIKSVSQIGDCVAPSIIAAAVHSGSKWARDLDQDEVPVPPYLPMPVNPV